MSNALTLVAERTGASVEDITEVLKGMIISAKNQHGSVATNAEMAIVSGVCATYGLNPLVKECAAFISGGKLQIVVMVDGWYKMINRQPDFDGVEFDDKTDDKGDLISITCRMFIKGRSRPVEVTEYMKECKDPKSSVWTKWPGRMLRHKAYIQAARMAFGISEIIDNDEAERMGVKGEREVTQAPLAPKADYTAIEAAMAECGDHEGLNEVCAGIRTEMEKLAIWDTEKVVLAGMKATHKARIDSYTPVSSASEFDEPEVTTASVTEDDDVPFE